jgi:hypothetical protein
MAIIRAHYGIKKGRCTLQLKILWPEKTLALIPIAEAAYDPSGHHLRGM